jgi:hypothetical protein
VPALAFWPGSELRGCPEVDSFVAGIDANRDPQARKGRGSMAACLPMHRRNSHWHYVLIRIYSTARSSLPTGGGGAYVQLTQ